MILAIDQDTTGTTWRVAVRKALGQFGHLAEAGSLHQDLCVLRRRDSSLEGELLRGIAYLVMRVDAKVDKVLELLGYDDGEEEMDA